jgi:peptidoglycan/xylan/chitin deacetylase (PgdA/CDA1 family)
METNPGVVKRAITEGHSVAFHSYTHTPWPLISNKSFEQELLKSGSALEAIVGIDNYSPTHFRTPWGILTPAINRTLTRYNLKVAYISFFVNDAWSGPKHFKQKMNQIKKHLLRNRGGAVVLHENCHSFVKSLKVDKSWLPDAVEDLILWAKENGLGFSQYGNKC